MKNITLSIDEEILAIVRRYAAERNTTVNGLVRDFLTRIATQEDKAAKARKRLVELSEKSEAEIGPINWKREDLYDRGMLLRHEHPGVRGVAEGRGGSKKSESD